MATALGPLVDDVVFVGGCITGLLVTQVRSQFIRPTEDVDVVLRYPEFETISGSRIGSENAAFQTSMK